KGQASSSGIISDSSCMSYLRATSGSVVTRAGCHRRVGRDMRERGVLQPRRVQVERTRHGPFERLSFIAMTPAGRSQHSLYRLGDTLIDAGGTVATAPLLALLRERPPRRIVCTHQHEDHV